MQKKFGKLIERHSIEISLCIHLLWFLSLYFLIHFAPIVTKPLNHSIPAYLFKEKEKPPEYDEEGHKAVEASQKEQPKEQAAPTPNKEPEQNSNPPPAIPTPKMVSNKVKEMEKRQKFTMMNIARDVQPVHLIGDKNVDKPLLILLGKALSAHLTYPKSAVDFGIGGIVLVGFMLSPDGDLNYVEIVRSSGAPVLDDEAFAAVKAMSPVKNVDQYLKESKFLVVGVVFG